MVPASDDISHNRWIKNDKYEKDEIHALKVYYGHKGSLEEIKMLIK